MYGIFFYVQTVLCFFLISNRREKLTCCSRRVAASSPQTKRVKLGITWHVHFSHDGFIELEALAPFHFLMATIIELLLEADLTNELDRIMEPDLEVFLTDCLYALQPPLSFFLTDSLYALQPSLTFFLTWKKGKQTSSSGKFRDVLTLHVGILNQHFLGTGSWQSKAFS